jgi:hypothetical protein
LQHAQVRVERGVGDAERQLGVHFVVELNAAGARHRETRRRRFELVGHQQAAHGEAAGHLADALVAEEQIADAPLDVVARFLESAAARGGEIKGAEQRRIAGECGQRQRIDGNAATGNVERIHPFPTHIGGAVDGAAALLHLDAVEADAGAFEFERGGRL